MYIDNILITIATKEQINYVANQLNVVFSLKALREVQIFLGYLVVRDQSNKTIKISQGPYIKKVLHKKGWTYIKGAGSLLDLDVKYDLDLPPLESKEKEEYLELVRSAQWISTNTWLDLAYIANLIDKTQEKPTS